MDSVSQARQSIENTVKIVSCCYVCNTLITGSNPVVASTKSRNIVPGIFCCIRTIRYRCGAATKDFWWVGYPRAFTILGAVTVLLISGYRYYRRMRGVPEAIGQLASGGSVHLTCGSPVYQRGRAAQWRHPCDGPAHCAADFSAVSQGNGETCCFLMLFNSIYWSMIDCR